MYRWYSISTYSGQENKVRDDLYRRAKSLGAEALIRNVVIPTQKVYEGTGADKKQVDKRTMPGYILVELELNETSWAVVRHTPGVTGFVSKGANPEPLSKLEVDRILGNRDKRISERKTETVLYHAGDVVRITNGPLKDFSGEISQVDLDNDTVTVSVSIFGRETPTKVPTKDVAKD